MAATTPTATEAPGAPVTRNNRPTRWFHTALYLVTTVLLVTGWWLRAGREGRPSPLAEAVGRPDVEVHRQAGWALAALAAAGVTLGARAAWTFVRETLRVDRGDGRWLRRWPVGAATGRFARHRGHFDPGQRIANLVFAGSLGTLVASGVALTTLSGGPTFATLVRVHRAATYVLTVAVVGHVVVASGVLPGYRGAWRAMHLRGRVPAATVRRLWPSSVEGPRPEPPEAPDSDGP
jgi:cytochrome b subunit of formate dehydrogenase